MSGSKLLASPAACCKSPSPFHLQFSHNISKNYLQSRIYSYTCLSETESLLSHYCLKQTQFCDRRSSDSMVRSLRQQEKLGTNLNPNVCSWQRRTGIIFYGELINSPRDPRPTNRLIFANAHNTLELGPGISPWGNGVGNLEFECLRTVSVVTLISSVCEVLSAVAFLDATHVVSLVVSCPRLSVTVGKRILCRGSLFSSRRLGKNWTNRGFIANIDAHIIPTLASTADQTTTANRSLTV